MVGVLLVERRLDDVVYGIIRERPAGEDRGDLLSLLLLARDEKGVGMSERQVRDEVMTPGGTTAAAFVAMEKAGFVAAVYDGVEAATERARRLG